MKIEMNQETKVWLQSKGKPVTIKSVEVTGCCAPPVHELMARLSKPKDSHNYIEINYDNIALFIEKKIFTYDYLQLKLSGFGLFKMLSAKVK